jgi:hypothetical protein
VRFEKTSHLARVVEDVRFVHIETVSEAGAHRSLPIDIVFEDGNLQRHGRIYSKDDGTRPG